MLLTRVSNFRTLAQIKNKPMKRLFKIAAAAALLMTFASCGGHTKCDAYGGQAKYSDYKAEHNQEIEMIQELTEQTK